MPAPIDAPRVLLRRLRDIMAAPESAETRLNMIVKLVAANMVAEVSSIYVMRPDGSQELFATEGLNPDAVHNTRMKPGEGLVGLIAATAEPVNLTEAQNHASFSYRPETGEEAFHSFLGVPILRSGNCLGVLTVQNKVQRRYPEDEVEALQTTAMVVAELLASGELEGANDAVRDSRQDTPQRIDGVALFRGIAIGQIVLHEPRVIVTKLVADNPQFEKQRVDQAIAELRDNIDKMLSRWDVARAGEHRDVLEAYRMFANDQGWIRRIKEAITTGLTAESAVERVQNIMRARMSRQTEPFFRERLHDLDDLSNRLLRQLAGGNTSAAREDLPRDTILIARTMGPAELLDYDRSCLRGLVLEDAGVSSHVTVIARALSIPTVGGAQDILEFVAPGDTAIVDGDGGAVFVRPTDDQFGDFQEKAKRMARRVAYYFKLRDQPAITKDGVRIRLNINAGLLIDLPRLDETGADGIGLFRTELLFMTSPKFPKQEQQIEMYRQVRDSAGDKPVIFRTLDIGSDKFLPYMRRDHEENPALGRRAIRLALDRPAVLRPQIRALFRACDGRDLRLMFPMISDVSEFLAVRKQIEAELAHLRRHGRGEPRRLLLGSMIEVPSILWQLDRLLPLVDFVSVGTNDLMQFLFAADRSNMHVAHRYDPLNPTFLRVIRRIIRKTGEYDVPVTICGEMASRPLEALALIGLGCRSLSMAPSGIGPVKAMVLGATYTKLQEKLSELAEANTDSIRDELRQWADLNQIEL